MIGAGTAGLATTLLLGQQGHDVTLVERAEALTTTGAGILLQPCGLAVLAAIGCLEHMQRYGHRIDALDGMTHSGRQVMKVRYAHLKEPQDVFGLGVHRTALCHVLDTATTAVAHRRWFGCAVESVQQRGDEALVHFCQHDTRHCEAFDAVIVANGSASRLRPPELVRYDRQYPWGAMWLIRPLHKAPASLDQPLLQQKYIDSSIMLGILPTGSIPDDPDTRLASLFWSVPIAHMPDWQNGELDLAGWKDEIAALWPDVSALIDDIVHPSQLVAATYRDVIMKRWGAGRMGIIGDAAHAMSPQLGQGANMALLDALAVSEAVRASSDWDPVWDTYASERGGSIRFYQRMSRFLTPLFQSNMFGAGTLRDWSFPVSHRIPWLRRQMAETVAGRKRKWLW